MTAPLFNLPIMSPAVGASTAAAGQDAATGFEALLATFFGTPGEPVPEALGDSQASDKDAGEQPVAADGQTTPPLSAEAQALAAMLVLAPVAQTEAAAAASDGEPTDAPAGSVSSPPVPFPPPGPAASADQTARPTPSLAPATSTAAEGEPGPDLADVAPPEPRLPAAAAATAPEVAHPASSQAVEVKSPTKATAYAQPLASAAPSPAPASTNLPPVAPAAQPAAQTQPLAAVAAPVSPSVMTQAQAPAEAPETELAPPRSPARNTKSADAAPRGMAQGAHTAPNGEAAPPTAVAPTANAMAFGQAASSVEAEKVAAPPQVESETAADVPDAPPAPAPAGPATPAAHAAPAHNAAPARATPETVAHLTAQISQKLEGHSSKFDIELNPAGLGRVSVSVEIAASGKMTAAMSFDSPQAAAELRARSSEIQRALEHAGFDLSGGLSFDVADRGDGRGAPQQQQNEGTAWRGRAFQALLDTTGEAAETASSLALNHGRRPNAGVDVRI